MKETIKVIGIIDICVAVKTRVTEEKKQCKCSQETTYMG